jgi:uncharacterized RDD family membrane protein YckC
MIIDTAIVWALPVVLTAIGDETEDDAVGTVLVAAYLLALAGLLLYGPLLMGRAGPRNGQTLGKQALGIRVVCDDGRPMAFGRGCVRELLGKALLGAATAGLWTLLDVVWPLGDGRRQALHDKLATTTVVRDPA